MTNKKRLEDFGSTIKHRRTALDLSIRELAKYSGVSAALISKLENGQMKNFPKTITIDLLSKALKFYNNELFTLADILCTPENTVKDFNINWQESLRALLATSTNLNAKNIEQSIYFIQGLETLQKIDDLY
ncbi:MAG: helix-turn-helix transcriptional regulator [Candidatus Gastranaerophilales bacterium]|nr:helix-turn-helix transcriptional regulator [Candidatus Gastranaerophilales bacterium]